MMITSIQNNRVKEWRKLSTKKGRLQTDLFLVEGMHLIEEALKSEWEIKEIILKEDKVLPTACTGLPATSVSNQVFHSISQTNSPQGIIAIIAMQEQDITYSNGDLLLIDAVQDPGNLGTMIRTADAAGFSAVLLGRGTVDLYNDKVIRATQGSLFHIPLYTVDLLEEMKAIKKAGYSVWATALENATLYHETPVGNQTALLVGNEGAGVDQELIAESDQVVHIPIYGKAESLNVSVATGILMYYLKG
jgi:TrmH family RNA methyltransferase